MTNRAHDWLRQAERDLEQAEDSRAAGRHEWACFAAHQAAEPFERRAVPFDNLRLPVPVDLLVYTQAEWARLATPVRRYARAPVRRPSYAAWRFR